MWRILVFLLSVFCSLAQMKEDCPPEGIAYLPDQDCTKYFLCVNGTGISLTCPDGLFFNPTVHECDFPYNVPECGTEGGTRPPPTTTEEPPETEPTAEPPTSTPPPTILRECGEKMVGDEGMIEYKFNETFDQHLRCAFIIRSLNHSGFIFNLEENGLVEDPTIQGGAISIFSFSAEGLMDISNLGPPNPLFQTYVSGAVVVVVFRTQDIRGTGFRLSFQATGTWKYDFANYDDLITGETPGAVLYPWGGGQYEFNTLSLFVLSHGHQEIFERNQTLMLNVHNVNIEKCEEVESLCDCDFLTIFSFTGNNLQTLDRICGTVSSKILFNTDGIFILLFKSDHSGNGMGFKAEFLLAQQ